MRNMFRLGLVALVLALAGTGCGGPALMGNHLEGTSLIKYKEKPSKVSRPFILKGRDFYAVNTFPSDLSKELSEKSGWGISCLDFGLVPLHKMGSDDLAMIAPNELLVPCDSKYSGRRVGEVDIEKLIERKNGYSNVTHQDLLNLLEPYRTPPIKGVVYYAFPNAEHPKKFDSGEYYLIPEDKIKPEILFSKELGKLTLYAHTTDGKIYELKFYPSGKVGVEGREGI